MFRMVQSSTSIPASFIVDPSAEFLPGQVAQLMVVGNQVVATVSNGLAPIGVIDEIRTKSFTAVSWQETVIVPAVGVLNSNNKLVTPIDIKAELENAYVYSSSFVSTVPVQLIPINGVIVFLAGTELNYDAIGSGTPNAIKTIVNYQYQVPNVPGDDSTMGSGRITVWFDRMWFQTDQYETNQQYPIGANLFVSEKGLFTTRKPSEFHPAVAMVSAPPTTTYNQLEVFYF